MPEPAPERRELPATMLEPCSFDDTPERERTPPDDSTPVRDEHGPLSRSRLRREAITAGRDPVPPDDTIENLRDRIAWLRDRWYQRPGLSEQADALDAALDEFADDAPETTPGAPTGGED